MTTEACIRIKNLRLRTFIGINDDEIRKKQDVIVNIKIHFNADHAVHSTAIEHTLNYKTITKEVIHLVEEGRFALLEKMTNEVLDLIMDHPEVRQAEVEVDKPHALRFADSVSITLMRKR